MARHQLGLLCILVSSIACGEEQASGTFDSLTYNVAGLPQGISGSDPENNIPQISPLLNSYDLVLLQEDFSYHRELLSRVSHPFRSEPKEDFTTYVNDGLNRLSEYSWTEFGREQWVDCYGDANGGAGDCLAEKGFSYARTELSEGVFVDVYNFHAEAGGSDEDTVAREAGYAQLIEFIKTKSVGRAVILGGDTNLHSDDPADLPILEKLIAELQIVDACRALGCPGENRIDKFFFRNSEALSFTPTKWRVGDEFVDSGGADLSDHKAVNVTFDWVVP